MSPNPNTNYNSNPNVSNEALLKHVTAHNEQLKRMIPSSQGFVDQRYMGPNDENRRGGFGSMRGRGGVNRFKKIGGGNSMNVRGPRAIQSLPAPINYDIPMITNLMDRAEKNPIALLHEYCSKIKKNITYQFDVQNEGRNKKHDHYICSIMIDKVGIIARGNGGSKKEAKTSSGDKALSYLVTTDPKARGILGEL